MSNSVNSRKWNETKSETKNKNKKKKNKLISNSLHEIFRVCYSFNVKYSQRTKHFTFRRCTDKRENKKNLLFKLLFGAQINYVGYCQVKWKCFFLQQLNFHFEIVIHLQFFFCCDSRLPRNNRWLKMEIKKKRKSFTCKRRFFLFICLVSFSA